MANSADEDWKKFLDSTKEPNEEVETDDELEDEDLNDDLPEDGESDPNAADAAKKGKQDPKESEDDEGDDDADQEDGEQPKPEDTYKPRLTQFLDKDGKPDLSKIEAAYIESGKEAVKLAEDNRVLKEQNQRILDAIAKDPEIAKKLLGEEGAKEIQQTNSPKSVDPILSHVEAQMKRQSTVEYNEFVEQHPESVSDPEKARLIGAFLKKHGDLHRELHDGEIPSMKDSLEAAYRYYGWELGESKEEKIAAAAKKAAATKSTPQGKKSAASKKQVDSQEAFFAKKLGVKLGR